MSAADGIFRCIFEGCISGLDSAIERRPYHKNCKCALHGGGNKKQKCRGRHGSSESISFPIRRSWSEGNILAMNFPSSNSSSNLQSLSSSSNLQSLSSSASLTNLVEDSSRSNQKMRLTIDEGDDY